MHFVRSMPAPQLGCTFGFGEQQNQITGFHDGSNVYGSDDEEFEKLRENKVSSHDHQQPYLPNKRYIMRPMQ